MIITFSGLDGAGKSTLIGELRKSLEQSGRKTVVRSMYDEISFYAVLRRLRDWIKGVPPSKDRTPPPSNTFNLIPNSFKPDVSDKKSGAAKAVYGFFRSRFTRGLMLYADLIVIWLYRLWDEALNGRVLITDRFVYDSIADILDRDAPSSMPPPGLLFLAPRPRAPIFVDVPAQVAFDRKAEYPLDYLEWRRNAYAGIFSRLKNPLVIDNTRPLESNVMAIRNRIQNGHE